MGVIRHEKQQYATPLALTNEVLAPTNNDTVYIESLKRTFDWIEGSTATADNNYVISQTSEAANGRWIASTVASVYTGTGNTDALDNGQSSVVDITIADVTPSKANLIVVSNFATFPSNLFVVSKEVVADETIRVVVENQSGGSVASFAVNITVLEF